MRLTTLNASRVRFLPVIEASISNGKSTLTLENETRDNARCQVLESSFLSTLSYVSKLPRSSRTVTHCQQPTETPHPGLWTLRFKLHKTTVLLFVDKTQSFSSIKSDLLNALGQRGLKDLNGEAIPRDPEDIVFGLPVDKNDLSQGWVGLEIPSQEIEDENGSKKKIGGKNSVLNASPLGAGLKDGSVLAFKFRKDNEKIDEDGVSMEDDDWDVVIPSYEDENASQSQR